MLRFRPAPSSTDLSIGIVAGGISSLVVVLCGRVAQFGFWSANRGWLVALLLGAMVAPSWRDLSHVLLIRAAGDEHGSLPTNIVGRLLLAMNGFFAAAQIIALGGLIRLALLLWTVVFLSHLSALRLDILTTMSLLLAIAPAAHLSLLLTVWVILALHFVGRGSSSAHAIFQASNALVKTPIRFLFWCIRWGTLLAPIRLVTMSLILLAMRSRVPIELALGGGLVAGAWLESGHFLALRSLNQRLLPAEESPW